jgi:cbb3-type cytochrome oxidase maturation protein
MDEGTIALTVMSLLLFLIFLGLLIWGIRSGQFRDIEEPKYTMLGIKREPPCDDETGRRQDGGACDVKR